MIFDDSNNFVSWLNNNQGVVSLAIFIVTLLLGWGSGIFSALRKRPNFKIQTIIGPTFCCTYNTGNIFNGHDAHITAFALYLNIANIGSASSSIEKIHIGYHWDLEPMSWNWLKYKIGWFWLKNEIVILEDFRVQIGEHLKVYPFLTQKNYLSPIQVDKFLEVGKSNSGIVYFEQPESWGACFPLCTNGKVLVKIKVYDVFGKAHTKKCKIDLVNLDEAKKFNPYFGDTSKHLSDS